MDQAMSPVPGPFVFSVFLEIHQGCRDHLSSSRNVLLERKPRKVGCHFTNAPLEQWAGTAVLNQRQVQSRRCLLLRDREETVRRP